MVFIVSYYVKYSNFIKWNFFEPLILRCSSVIDNNSFVCPVVLFLFLVLLPFNRCKEEKLYIIRHLYFFFMIYLFTNKIILTSNKNLKKTPFSDLPKCKITGIKCVSPLRP